MLSPDDIERLRDEFDPQLQVLSAAEAREGYRRGTAAVPRAIEPHYSLAAPSTVPLYAGPLLFPPRDDESAEQVNGTVSLELTPRPRVLVRGMASRVFHLEDLLEGVSSLQLPAMSSLPLAPQGPLDTGDSSWLGPPRGYVIR